ncbi:glycoside hydrolase family protein [Cyclobacterium jeungdonense]|uniref:Glycoside hydrolase family protein n=1 Tax=Cyclobacterium jeungdonense TaxID=708087 RepID=A0ABT8C946_9BACT|nr:glycoside hydrolase family protein [Cyclobacterium jeungdonense]MDN3688544.1 glycoside hydrolase family protein [Cyclobacterium jeungdonense]
MNKKLFIFSAIAGILMGMHVSAQTQKNPLILKDRLQPLTEKNIFKTDDYFNWCSSIIKGEDGKYHLFYSRWPKKYTFLSWLTHSEVAHAIADNPSGPWEYKETVLKSRGPGHWDAITAHNPKIKKFGDTYYLYYISTNLGDKTYTDEELIETARVGYSHPNWKEHLRPNQRTGVAVAKSLNGPWTRMDQPLLEPSGPISTLTVNPAIAQGEDGKYYLIVKGDKPNDSGFTRNQAVAIADSPTGPFEIQSTAVIDDMDTEDMSVWYDHRRNRFYGIFHAHSFIGMIQSTDGINWSEATPFEIQKKRIPIVDGPALIPDRMERPFLYQEAGEPKVLSMAIKMGDEAYIVFVPVQQNPNRP